MEEATIILPQIDKELARRRNEQIVAMVNKGVKQSDVARMYKLSRQRVHQILRSAREESK